jgi:hypothetical protein
MGSRWAPGKYRWRTRLRGFLPLALTRFIAKGRGDCGNHEWYKSDAAKDHCYHCRAERPTEITRA